MEEGGRGESMGWYLFCHKYLYISVLVGSEINIINKQGMMNRVFRNICQRTLCIFDGPHLLGFSLLQYPLNSVPH